MARRSNSQDENVTKEVTEEVVTDKAVADEVMPKEPDVPTDIDEQIQEITDLELMESGEPVKFKIGDKEFAIRQLEPIDLEMVRLQESIGYHLALDQPGMDELQKLPVSDEAKVERMIILAKLKSDHEAAEDPEKRRDLSDQIQEWSKPDNRTRAQEIADRHARRYRDRWIVEHLVCYPDGTKLSIDDMQLFKRPINMDTARPACWRVIKLATSVPN